MRIYCVSDLHLDARTGGVERFDDVAASLDAVAHAASTDDGSGGRRVFLFLGDLCDPGARAHRCVEKAIRVDRTLRGRGVASYWLAGNHDVVEDGSGATTLSPMRGAGCEVLDRPVVFSPAPGVLVVALPFVPRSHAYDPDAFAREAAAIGDARTVLVLSHLSVEGIEPGSEVHDMPRGREVMLPSRAIADCFGDRALVIQGHFHRGQRYVTAEGVVVLVVGSAQRLTHGEEQNAPGYLVLEVPDAA